MYSKLLQQILSGFGLLTGASYPFQTLALFWRSPSLLPYIIIPLLLNIGLGIFLYWQLFSWEQNTIEIILINSRDQWQIIYNQLPTWLQGIEILIQVLFWVVKLFLQLATLILTGFILAQIGVLLGAPWYGRLSEKLEFLRLGKCYLKEVGLLREIQRAIAFELKKLVIIIGLGFPCFLFNFFPGIGPLIATIGGITITTTLTCLDFLDQPLERRRLSFRAKLGMIIYTSLNIDAISNENQRNETESYWFWQYMRYARAVSNNNKEMIQTILHSLIGKVSQTTTDTAPDSFFEEDIEQVHQVFPSFFV
jgi:CysZ protein